MDTETRDSDDLLTQKTIYNPTILTHILEYLPDADLKNCRLVATNWNELALDELKKRYSEYNNPIILKSDNCLRRFTETFGDKTKHVFHSAFDFQNSSSNDKFTWPCFIKFFNTFGGQISKLELGVRLTLLQFQKLLELQGPQLIALEVNFVECFQELPPNWTVKKYGKIMKSGTMLLPKLEILCLTSSRFLVPDKFSMHFLKTILSCIPKGQLVYTSLANWPDIATTITHLSKHGQVKSLRDLSVDCVGNEDLKVLTRTADLQLEEFHFRILDDDSHFDRILVQKFFTAQRSTLKNLCWASCVCPFPATGITQLEDLTLWFYHFDEPAAQPIFYKEMFPNLIKLRLGGMFYDQVIHRAQLERLILHTQPPCERVRKVQILDAFLTGPSTQRMSEIFPNISSLKIRTHEHHGSYEEIFRAIWNSPTFASSLEKLELDVQYRGMGCHREVQILTQPMRLDQVFSGASDSEIQRFNRGKCFEKCNLDQPK